MQLFQALTVYKDGRQVEAKAFDCPLPFLR